MTKILFGLLCLVNAVNSYGQYTDSTQYYTGLISTGSFNYTNSSSSYILSNKLNVGIRKKAIMLDFNNSWVYGEQQRTLTNNDVNSTFNCNVYKLVPHAYYWGLATYTSSFSLSINRQFQAGAGLAYNIIDGKKARLNLSDGFVYENNDIFLNDTIRDVYSTGRNSARVALRFDSNIFTFNSTAFLQNSLSAGDDYIVKADVTLAIKVRKWVAFTTAYSYNRFNRTGKENTLLTIGLTVEHYY